MFKNQTSPNQRRSSHITPIILGRKEQKRNRKRVKERNLFLSKIAQRMKTKKRAQSGQSRKGLQQQNLKSKRERTLKRTRIFKNLLSEASQEKKSMIAQTLMTIFQVSES